MSESFFLSRQCNTVQHSATQCYIAQHTATHCNTLQHTLNVTRQGKWVLFLFEALQHNATLCATHCNTLQHTATHCNTAQHNTTHCNTLQHCATHTHVMTLDKISESFFLSRNLYQFHSIPTALPSYCAHPNPIPTHTPTRARKGKI